MTIHTSIVSFLGICSVSLAGGLGCQQAQPSDSRAGTINFVVRQSPTSPTAVASGSFDVRGLDNDEHARVGIGRGTARTLSVRLPAGSYAVAWNPTLPGEAATRSRSESAHDGAEQEWPQIVVVTPDGASVVDVVLSPQAAPAEQRIELASVGPRGAL
jgi:hypothetical protein